MTAKRVAKEPLVLATCHSGSVVGQLRQEGLRTSRSAGGWCGSFAVTPVRPM